MTDTAALSERRKLAEIKEALGKAVWDALETGGIELLKATSMFISNRAALSKPAQDVTPHPVETVQADVQRWDLCHVDGYASDGYAKMIEGDNGNYVKFSDYEAVKNESENAGSALNYVFRQKDELLKDLNQIAIRATKLEAERDEAQLLVRVMTGELHDANKATEKAEASLAEMTKLSQYRLKMWSTTMDALTACQKREAGLREAAMAWATLQRDMEHRLSSGGFNTKRQDLDLFDAEEVMKDAARVALNSEGV